MSNIGVRVTPEIRALRNLLGLLDLEEVSCTMLMGLIDVENWETGVMETHETGDLAFVFLGPRDKLDGTFVINEDGTRTITVTVRV